MRTLILVTIALSALAAAVVAVPVKIVSTRDAKAELAQRIGALVGGPVALHGEPVLTLLPSPGIVVQDVVVSSPGDTEGRTLARIPTLRATVRVLPLLSGSIELGTVDLDHPSFDLGGGAEQAGTPGEPERWLRTLLSQGAASYPGVIAVRDGVLRYEDRRHGRVETITAIDLRLDWQRSGRAAALSGRFAWRGRTVELEAELDDPPAIFAEAGSGARAKIVVEPAPRDDAVGDRAGGSDSDRTGTADEDGQRPGPPAEALAERLGIPLAPSRRIGPLHVEGTVRVVAGMLTLSDASVDVAGSPASTSLALRSANGRRTLQGSLAFDGVDLGRGARAFLPRTVAELLALPVSTGWLADLDVDLWVSTDEAEIAEFRLTEVAARLTSRSGRAAFRLLHAGFADGLVEGLATVVPAPQGVAVALSGRIDGISVERVGRGVRAALATPLIGADGPPQGTGSATFAVAGEGSMVGAILRSADGWVRGEIEDGSMGGADIVATLEQVAAHGDEAIASGKPFIPVGGRTDFDRLSVNVTVADAVARIEQIRYAGGQFDIELAGRTDLSRGEVEVGGVARLYDSDLAAGRMHPRVELPFGMGGSLRDLVLAPGVPRIRNGAASGELRQGRHEPAVDTDWRSDWCTVRRYLGEPFGFEPSCRSGRSLAGG